jgi:hypothetical protein
LRFRFHETFLKLTFIVDDIIMVTEGVDFLGTTQESDVGIIPETDAEEENIPVISKTTAPSNIKTSSTERAKLTTSASNSPVTTSQPNTPTTAEPTVPATTGPKSDSTTAPETTSPSSSRKLSFLHTTCIPMLMITILLIQQL